MIVARNLEVIQLHGNPELPLSEQLVNTILHPQSDYENVHTLFYARNRHYHKNSQYMRRETSKWSRAVFQTQDSATPISTAGVSATTTKATAEENVVEKGIKVTNDGDDDGDGLDEQNQDKITKHCVKNDDKIDISKMKMVYCSNYVPTRDNSIGWLSSDGFPLVLIERFVKSFGDNLENLYALHMNIDNTQIVEENAYMNSNPYMVSGFDNHDNNNNNNNDIKLTFAQKRMIAKISRVTSAMAAVVSMPQLIKLKEICCRLTLDNAIIVKTIINDKCKNSIDGKCCIERLFLTIDNESNIDLFKMHPSLNIHSIMNNIPFVTILIDLKFVSYYHDQNDWNSKFDSIVRLLELLTSECKEYGKYTHEKLKMECVRVIFIMPQRFAPAFRKTYRGRILPIRLQKYQEKIDKIIQLCFEWRLDLMDAQKHNVKTILFEYGNEFDEMASMIPSVVCSKCSMLSAKCVDNFK